MNLYFKQNERKRKYNIYYSRKQDGYIKYIPNKNYNNYNYNDISTQKNNNYIKINSHKKENYEDNSEY